MAVRTGKGMEGVDSLVTDRSGTPVAVIDNVDWATNPVQRVFSDPFGAIRGASDAELPGDHRFLGAPRDDTGLTLLGARYYDTFVGAFISVDPILDAGNPAQFNAYVYGWNNPVTFSDPSGLIAIGATDPGPSAASLKTPSPTGAETKRSCGRSLCSLPPSQWYPITQDVWDGIGTNLAAIGIGIGDGATNLGMFGLVGVILQFSTGQVNWPGFSAYPVSCPAGAGRLVSWPA